MLNADTKRHIDAARDVLVGVAPNPMTQIDQITYALIYKFMDDMDEAAIKAGGDRSFFTGDLAPYAWSNLVDTRIGSQEKMDLFAEALTKFAEAPQLPELFRTIFRAAFLPYRSPETLGLFIKEINYFDYSHPEELGNAYEYLLSIMSAQGDAGQFRTPRHIIDFMVDVLDPTKDDTILDPACGTGGFLVSSYNHILEKHDGKDDPNGTEKPLTPAERKKLTQNLAGYDIDPSMVRIAQVNMYLHQFKNPQIFQYDGLTSEERWNDKFDVILANPPFMSPKGGIKPHNKFGIKSNRSEVLFVDYIVSHLKPSGRAAIVVPEGVIFQSGKAYKELRKSLVEGGLYAVVSLPGGVFQPYSGVKTSILFIDNLIAKQKSEIAFIKVSADGFDLGSTKRIIEKNDLPRVLELLLAWKSGEQEIVDPIVTYVQRIEIAKSDGYTFSVGNYQETLDRSENIWEFYELSEVANIAAGNSAPQDAKSFQDGIYPFFRTSDVGAVHLSGNLAVTRDKLSAEAASSMKMHPKGTILFPKSGASTFLNHRVMMGVSGFASSHLATIKGDPQKILDNFLYYILMNVDARALTADQSYPSLKLSDISKIRVPIPPLDVQEQIVAELDGYAAIVSGAKQIVENWKPQIFADSEWPNSILGDIASFEYGVGKSASETGKYRFVRITDIDDFGLLKTTDPKYIDLAENELNYILKSGDVLMARTGATFGKCLYFESDIPSAFAGYLIRISLDSSLLPRFFWMYSQGLEFERQKQKLVTGGGQPQFNANALAKVELAVPPLETQAELISAMEAEKLSVDAARRLIETYEAKTQAVIAKLWSE